MKPLVVITGASSGFGAAVARMLSDAGHPLLLLARRLERMEALGLPNTLCREVDVTDRGAFEAAVREAECIYGPVDCLINNAGAMLLGKLDTQERSEWQRMLDLNVLALLDGMQIVIAGMKERQTGTIINISSVAGRKAVLTHPAYCGTKFAVHAISEAVRQDLAPHNVRVIVISPGAAETELLSHTTDETIKNNYTTWKDAMGGAISAEDVARSIVFTYQQPQSVCIRELCLAPTKQDR